MREALLNFMDMYTFLFQSLELAFIIIIAITLFNNNCMNIINVSLIHTMGY